MTALNQTEMLVLGHLSPNMFGGGDYITQSALSKRLSSDLSGEHLDVILRYLYTSGLVERCELGGQMSYKASDAGNAAVRVTESIIGREESARLRARVEKLAEVYSLPTVQKKAINWTMWGTILAGIGIVVTIALALVH